MAVIKINKHKQDPDPSLVEGCLVAVFAVMIAFFAMMLQAAAWGTFIFLVYKVLVFFGLFA